MDHNLLRTSEGANEHFSARSTCPPWFVQRWLTQNDGECLSTEKASKSSQFIEVNPALPPSQSRDTVNPAQILASHNGQSHRTVERSQYATNTAISNPQISSLSRQDSLWETPFGSKSSSLWVYDLFRHISNTLLSASRVVTMVIPSMPKFRLLSQKMGDH